MEEFQSLKNVKNDVPNDKYYKKAVKLADQQKHLKAIEMLKKSLEINPNNLHVILSIVDGYQILGEFGKMIPWLKNLIEFEPNNADLWLNLGNSQKKVDQFEEAIKSLDESLKLDPNQPPALVLKGNCYWSLEEHDNAIKCYDQAIKIDVNYGLAWKNKIDLLMDLGKEEEARQTYEQLQEAIREKPELVNITPIKIPEMETKGLKFISIGDSNMTVAMLENQVYHVVDIYGVKYEQIKLFEYQNQLIAAIESIPGAFNEIQSRFNLYLIEVRKRSQ